MLWKMLHEGSLGSLCNSGAYIDTKRGMSNIPMVKRIARMTFFSRMNNLFIRKKVLV